MASGLSRMARKHIHFAQDSHLIRHNRSIFIEVDMAAAMADGIKFYRSQNGVILTAGNDGILDSKYLTVHDRNASTVSVKTSRKHA
jgi:2'-phosphotransferase